jgi:hypothetical protein
VIATLVVIVHVLSVFWLVAGILGRGLAHAMTVSATDLAQLEARHEMASLFERVAVRPASFFVLGTGLAAAGLRGWPVLGVLQGAPIQWPLVSLLLFLSIIPIIVVVFLPRGRVFRAALEEATRERRITPGLSAALNDPWVHAARIYEIAMLVVVTVLMVAKPF